MIYLIMCTYNGEKYITKQLQSIQEQSLQPDSVIVFDDRSTDKTVEKANEFIAQNKLDWTVKVNDVNKGWRLNFFDAINSHYNDNDVVFYCDQDDIWDVDKIKLMSVAMKNNCDILRLSGEQLLIDANGESMSSLSIHTCRLDYDASVYPDDYKKCRYGIDWDNRIGCAMCVRGKLLNMLTYFGRYQYFSHDLWSVLVSDALKGGYLLDYPVIKYRVHGENASIGNKIYDGSTKTRCSHYKKMLAESEYYLAGLYRLAQANYDVDEKVVEQQKGIVDYYRLRVDVLGGRKLFKLFANKREYYKYNDKKQFLGDFAACLGLLGLFQKCASAVKKER